MGHFLRPVSLRYSGETDSDLPSRMHACKLAGPADLDLHATKGNLTESTPCTSYTRWLGMFTLVLVAGLVQSRLCCAESWGVGREEAGCIIVR